MLKKMPKGNVISL